MSILVYEDQSNPYLSTGPNDTTVGNPTSYNDYYANFYVGNGSNVQYSVSSNHPNWQSLGNGIRIWAMYRNARYDVTITVTTYRYDGGSSKSASYHFYVYEPNWPAPYATSGSPIQYVDVSNTDTFGVYLPQYFNGSGTNIWFALSNPGYNNNCWVSGDWAYVLAQNRNIGYDVWVNCYSAGGSCSAYFHVEEHYTPPV
jgi:hypothetical protein